MMRHLRVRETRGFTLVELTIVVAIIGLLASFAIPMFANFLKKAKMVEGELALTEIRRLEQMQFNDNLQYSTNLTFMNFAPIPPLKYYTITVQLNGVDPYIGAYQYQAIATGNVDNDPDLDVWVLTLDANNVSTIQHGCMPGGVGQYQQNCTD